MNRNHIIFGLMALVGLVLVIAIPVAMTRKNKQEEVPTADDATPTMIPSSVPSATPTSAPTTMRYVALMDFLIENLPEDLQQGLVHDETTMPMGSGGEKGTNTTPQLKAALWLADSDAYTAAMVPSFVDIDPTITAKLLQRYVLVVLYFALGGDNYKEDCPHSKTELCQWVTGGTEKWLTPDVDECQWAFLTCNAEGIVEGIMVQRGFGTTEDGEFSWFDNIMTGTFPKEMVLLTNLQTLQVEKNQIEGDLDTAFAGMTSLVVLDVQENLLSGTFPNGMLQSNQNLEKLNLWGNAPGVSGPVVGIGQHPALRELELSGSGVNGSLHDLLMTNVNSSRLQVLGLSETEISGTIPSSISRYSNLETLSLAKTNLQGTLPAELFSVKPSRLRGLELPMTGLSGTLPDSMFFGGTSLGLLDLSSNRFTGTIPERFRWLNASLEDLLLNDNEFTGSIPEAFDHLTALETLRLDGNQLTGYISAAVCAERGLGVQALAELVVDCVVTCTCCDRCRD